MLKFFRRIRQNLLKEGRFRKYLVYAIGEIILVVIGILVALQVNNWNENQKLRSTEFSLLKEISVDIGQNIGQIKDIISADYRHIQKGEYLLKILKDSKSVFHDSLKYSFGIVNSYLPFEHTDGAYDNLKQKGLDIIQDDSLKIEIRYLFEELFPGIEKTGNSFREKVYFQSSDVFIKYFETETNLFSKKPNSFNELKRSHEFINMFTYVLASRRQARNIYQNRLDQALKIKRFIDEKIQEFEL